MQKTVEVPQWQVDVPRGASCAGSTGAARGEDDLNSRSLGKIVEIPEIQIVQDDQTCEYLDTAPVAQTEIVVVVEIGALLPTESAHPDVRGGSRLGVSSSCCGLFPVRSRCGVCDVHTRAPVVEYATFCAHRFLRFSVYHKNSGVKSSQRRQCRSQN